MRGIFSKKEKSTPPPPPASAPPPQQQYRQDDAARSALFGNRPQQASAQHNPYGAPPPQQQQQQQGGYGGYGQQQQQQGGYGGYGRAESTSTLDRNRDELFAGRQSAPPAYGAAPSSGSYARPTGYADDKDRVLTAEEEEEEDVDAVKQQIRFTKQESVSSTRNALRIAAQAEETGRTTLARLGEQGERLHNAEKNLDMASAHNRVADEKARELKTLNRSMFAVHVANPLKSKSRAEAEERRILERHESERSERERTRQQGYAARESVGRALNSGRGGAMGGARAGGKVSLAERSKYQFEADESDDEKEREIEGNLDALSGITGRLKGLAVATGQEVDRQNKQIDVISKKSDGVDNQITLTHNAIKKIH